MGGSNDQFLTFNAESESAQILKSLYSVCVEGEGEMGGNDDQFPTFDAEFNSAKIPKSFYDVGDQ